MRKLTAARPVPPAVIGPSAPEASSRRLATPTWFEGTTTVTGASGSPALELVMARWSASAAGRPYATHSTCSDMASEVTQGV